MFNTSLQVPIIDFEPFNRGGKSERQAVVQQIYPPITAGDYLLSRLQATY